MGFFDEIALNILILLYISQFQHIARLLTECKNHFLNASKFALRYLTRKSSIRPRYVSTYPLSYLVKIHYANLIAYPNYR